MTNKLQKDFDLDALFADEKVSDMMPSETFMNAVLRDANDVQASFKEPARVEKSTLWWQGIVQQMGGWQAVSTFATCACFGLYIGYASSVDKVLGYTSGTDSAAISDVFDSFSVASEFEVSFLEG
jgi:hypothetical protein